MGGDMQKKLTHVVVAAALAGAIAWQAAPSHAFPSFGLIGFANFGHNQSLGLVGLNPQPIPPGLVYRNGSHVTFLYPSCSKVTSSSEGRIFVATGRATDHRWYQIVIVDQVSGPYPDAVGVRSSLSPTSACNGSIPTQYIGTGAFFIHSI